MRRLSSTTLSVVVLLSSFGVSPLESLVVGHNNNNNNMIGSSTILPIMRSFGAVQSRLDNSVQQQSNDYNNNDDKDRRIRPSSFDFSSRKRRLPSHDTGRSYSSSFASRKYSGHNNKQGIGGGNGSNWNGSFQHRQKWLKQATSEILATTPGTLRKGKWHELVSVLKANAKYAKVDERTPQVMELLVKRLLDEVHPGGNTEAVVNIEIYNVLLDVWCCQALFLRTNKDGPKVASQRAREILVLLQENFEQKVQQQQLTGGNATSALSLQPDEQSFSMVFDVVLKVEGPAVARRILAWMEFIFRKGRNDRAQPGRGYYIRLLQAYADGAMPELAEGFLRHMTMTDVDVDTFCYNIALKSWAKQGGRQAAEHADRLLEQMTAPKDVVTYATVMSAWSRSGMRSHAVARVEDLLRQMEVGGLEPNHVVVNTIMGTWIKSKNLNASNRTSELLAYLESPDSSARPDLMTYNNHIKALTLSRRNVKIADALLLSLTDRYNTRELRFRPNTYSFNLVIDAWAQSNEYEASWNAARLLRIMIHRDDTPEPDTFSFNQVFKALSRSRRPRAAKLAEELLTTMEEGHDTKLFPSAKPDVATYTSVIVALSRSGEADACERGEHVLAKLRGSKIQPTRAMYNALITLWGKSGRGTYGARRAEQLLNEMKENGVEPNTVSYNTVMDSWSRSGTRCCGNKAEGYLELLLSDGTMKPDTVSFNTCLNAISKSRNHGKAQRALRVLRRMEKLFPVTGARPDVVSYTSVLNAAKRSRSLDSVQRTRNLDTARHTLRELRSSRWDHPNEVSYTTFIQACYGLSEDETVFRVVLEDVFELCCADGQVGPQVISVLRRVAPDDFLQRHNLVDVQLEDLPPSWRRHVREITKLQPNQLVARRTRTRSTG